MLRILIVVVTFVLAGCATQPDYSHLRSDEPLTHFMIRYEPPYACRIILTDTVSAWM